MFNPLIENLSKLSDDELLTKINELQQRMSQASAAGMFSAVQQINILLNEYREENHARYTKKLEEHKENYDELIDVNKNT